nr:MAG TPA: hypothetical protein [Caudoviricetes sp.]
MNLINSLSLFLMVKYSAITSFILFYNNYLYP